MIYRETACIPDFFPRAQEMRADFEKQFQNPHEAHEKRFVWDPWYIEDQYSLLRTPAYHYFPEELYQAFEDYLILWGQRHLGCHRISPPWMSCYTDGCFQNLHSDSPHGPWAFVFSLTPWKTRRFTGGETQILRPEVLEYWQNFNAEKGLEKNELFISLPPEMNQLTLFDPRLPHGVKEVRGSKNPLEGRLVIHGWFVDPGPFVEGPLSERQDEVGEVINKALDPLLEAWAQSGESHFGQITIHLEINTKGYVTFSSCLTDTLRPSAPGWADEARIALEKLVFPTSPEDSSITLPLVFQ